MIRTCYKGSSTQYSVMAYGEKNILKSEYMYMYNKLTLLYTWK